MFPSRFVRLQEFASATLAAIRSPNRSEIFGKGLNEWTFLKKNRLPVEYLTRLWPEISGQCVRTDVSNSHHFELPYGERTIVAALVEYLRPMKIFEFGTFTGSTTRLIADVMPNGAVVHTIDLPTDQIVWEDWIGQVIAREFSSDPAYQDKVVLHRCNSRDFDFSRFAGQMDLVFIDASHEYEDVLHDSQRALGMLADDGTIVWDDYDADVPGVVAALNELSKDIQLVRIAHSRLVVHKSTPFPGLPELHRTPWTPFPFQRKVLIHGSIDE